MRREGRVEIEVTPRWLVCTDQRLEGECLGQVLKRRMPFLRDPLVATMPAVALEGPPVHFAVVSSSFTTQNALPRFIRELSSRGTRVLLCTKNSTSSAADAAALAGAAAIYDTNGGVGEFLDAVRSTLANPSPSPEPIGSTWGGSVPARSLALTVAEQRVVDTLFTPCATTASTALTLGLSVQTVRNHLTNIRGKLTGTPTSNLTSLRFALIDAGLIDHYPRSTSKSGVMRDLT